MPPTLAWLRFAPHLGLVLIAALGLLGQWSGLYAPGTSNTFALLGISGAAVALLAGTGALALMARGRPWWSTAAIALSYVPATLAALLLSGL